MALQNNSHLLRSTQPWVSQIDLLSCLLDSLTRALCQRTCWVVLPESSRSFVLRGWRTRALFLFLPSFLPSLLLSFLRSQGLSPAARTGPLAPPFPSGSAKRCIGVMRKNGFLSGEVRWSLNPPRLCLIRSLLSFARAVVGSCRNRLLWVPIAWKKLARKRHGWHKKDLNFTATHNNQVLPHARLKIKALCDVA